MIAKDSKNRLFELMGRVNPSFINEDMVRGLTLNDYPTYITSNPEIQLNGNYIKLYHFGDDGGTGYLDPSHFGKNPYTTDAKQWDMPRVMFYVNVDDKEHIVSGKPYETEYDITKLYPFNKDPLYFYEDCMKDYNTESLHVNLQLSCISSKAKENGFDGFIMKWRNTIRVDIWKKVKVEQVG